MNRKGFQVGDMLPLGLTIVVLGIGLSLGLTVLNDFKADQCSGWFNSSDSTCYNATDQGAIVGTDAYNGTGDAISGINKFTGYLPTIGLVIVVAVIIGIIVRYLFTR